MKLWVAVYGQYADAQPVGVSTTEEGARDLVRTAYREDHPSHDWALDPMADVTAGEALGPFTVDELRVPR